jgi:hypothetical protein
MPTRSSIDRDLAVNGFRVVERAIGERMDGTPLEDLVPGKIRQQWHLESSAAQKVAKREPLSSSLHN